MSAQLVLTLSLMVAVVVGGCASTHRPAPILAWEEPVPIAEAVTHRYTVAVDGAQPIAIGPTCDAVTAELSTCEVPLPRLPAGAHRVVITIGDEASADVVVTMVREPWWARLLNAIQWGR